MGSKPPLADAVLNWGCAARFALALLVLSIPNFTSVCLADEQAAAQPASVTTDTTPGVSADKSYILDKVTVSADKREEDLQDVPISAQSFRGSQLEAKGINSIEQLGQLVPGLQFTAVAGFPLIFMRGLGTDNIVPSADSSVAIYIDGIYSPIGIAGVSALSGIKSVEVDKGPQGTLYGRDATGGAINIRTEDPGNNFRLIAAQEIGTMTDRNTRLSISGPLSDWLSAGVSATYSRQHSPYSDAYYAPPADQLAASRLKLLLHSDTVSLELTGYYGNSSGTETLIAKNVQPNLLGIAAGIMPEKNDFAGQVDHAGFTQSNQNVVYGTFAWEAPFFDLKVLGSDQRLVTPNTTFDYDASPQPLVALTTTNTYTKIQTAEIQALSNSGSWDPEHFHWVLGLYYLQGKIGVDPFDFEVAPGAVPGLTNILNQPALSQIAQATQNLLDDIGLVSTPLGSGGLSLLFSSELATRSLAAYSQSTYNIWNWLDITLGGRIQHEDRHLTKSESGIADALGSGEIVLLRTPLPGGTSDNFSPKVALSAHLDPQTMGYASYSVAYKDGTFNTVNVLTIPSYVLPERAESFEIGAKFFSADQTVQLDADVFDTRISNLQSGFISVFAANRVEFLTVPHARSRGAEVDTRWVLLQGRDPFVLSINAAYVDAIYTDYPDGAGYNRFTGLAQNELNLSGDRAVYSPRFTGTVSAAQGLQIGPGAFEIAVDEYFNSGYFTDAYNTTLESPFAILNARIGYRYIPWQLSTTLFCKNALDRRYDVVNVPTDFGNVRSLAQPRLAGVRFEWSFQ